MSRSASGQAIEYGPTNNIYTVLTAVAVVVQIVAFIALVMRSRELLPPNGIFK